MEREVTIGRRVPLVVVDAVEDADRRLAARAQVRIETVAVSGVQISCAYVGLTVVTASA